MTPAASGSAPSQSPSQAEAASGPKGEALLAHRQHAPAVARRGHPRSSQRRTFGQGRMVQPRRIRQRSRRRQHCGRSTPHQQTRSRKDSARFHQRQHRHRLRHARRRSRIPRHALRAGECFSRAKTNSTSRWRKYHLHRPRRRLTTDQVHHGVTETQRKPFFDFLRASVSPW